MLGYVWERTLHVAKAIVKGIVKKFLKARKSSEKLGNARERSRGFATKGDKAIVVECVNNGISAYRRVTDRSTDSEYKTFMRFCTEFFISDGKLWRKKPERTQDCNRKSSPAIFHDHSP